jgi:hypothetical protein
MDGMGKREAVSYISNELGITEDKVIESLVSYYGNKIL